MNYSIYLQESEKVRTSLQHREPGQSASRKFLCTRMLVCGVTLLLTVVGNTNLVQGQATWSNNRDRIQPSGASRPSTDSDDDTIENEYDPDIDDDTIPNEFDPDVDGDGRPNNVDPDIDGDGKPNGADEDSDGDGKPNEIDPDVDGDGEPNDVDPDIDGDGVQNGQDGDVDGDGVPNGRDPDIDGDGIPNEDDADMDGDGIPNDLDPDKDGDGILDENESTDDENDDDDDDDNHNPVAQNGAVAVARNASRTIIMSATDEDGDKLTFTIVSPPTHGNLSGTTYTPSTNYVGGDSFTFKANDGTADSNVATMSINIVVPKSWSTDTLLGVGRNANGDETHDGRMTAPQDQTANNFMPAPIHAAAGTLLACSIETASDYDYWVTADDQGDSPDTIDDPKDYVWTGGLFVTGPQLPNGSYPTASEFTGRNATLLVPQAGMITLVCTVTNHHGGAVTFPHSGNRIDQKLVRSVEVISDGAVTSETAMQLQFLKHDGAATENSPEILNPVSTTGGGTYVALRLHLGQGVEIQSDTAELRLNEDSDPQRGISHSFETNHKDFHVNFAQVNGWEKFFDPDGAGPKEKGWWPATESPKAATTATESADYRIRFAWNTAEEVTGTSKITVDNVTTVVNTKLLGHNGKHSISLQSVNDSVGAGIDYGSQEAYVPSSTSVNVVNLAIKSVTMSDGNPDVVLYDPESNDSHKRSPRIAVAFEDEDFQIGDSYHWQMFFPETGSTSSPSVLGSLNGVFPFEVAMPESMAAGVYGYGLILEKVRGTHRDEQRSRSIRRFFSATQLSSTEDPEAEEDVDDGLIKFKYRIVPSAGEASPVSPLKEVRIRTIDVDYQERGSVAGAVTALSAEDADHTVTPVFATDTPGTARIIATGEDDEADSYRDHKSRRLIPQNAKSLSYSIQVLNGPDFPGGALDAYGGGLPYNWPSATGFWTHLPYSKQGVWVNSQYMDTSKSPELLWRRIHAMGAKAYRGSKHNLIFVQSNGHANRSGQDISTMPGMTEHASGWVLPPYDEERNDYLITDAPDIVGVSTFHAMGCRTSARATGEKYHYKAVAKDYAQFVAVSKKARNSVGYLAICYPELANGRKAGQLWQNCFYRIGLSGRVNQNTGRPVNATAFDSLYIARQKYKQVVLKWATEDGTSYGFGNFDQWVVTYPGRPLIDAS